MMPAAASALYSQRLQPLVRFPSARLPRLILALGCLLPACAGARPVDFSLPAQPAPQALLEFSKQAGLEVLFSYEGLQNVQTTAVAGPLEPEDALHRLLLGTGLAEHRNAKGKFVVTVAPLRAGTISGRLVTPDGAGARGLQLSLSPGRQLARTDDHGGFRLTAVPPGVYQLTATGGGFQSLRVESLKVAADHELALADLTMTPADDVTRLETIVVTSDAAARPFDRSKTPFQARTAVGNLDLPRTENDVLPYTIYEREQILQSGVVDLNEFLQRAVLESDARPPEQSGSALASLAGSTNLNLRGYGTDETVILINGRRIPEVMTGMSGSARSVGPDVNFIPLSLVEQIEVLPVSSSALYSGNAFGGVINIVLRQGLEANATEVTAGYTNALGRFDAPQSSVSLLNSQSLLRGKLHLLLSASFTRAEPPTEAELGYLRARAGASATLPDPIYRATPNVRSADRTPLFGAGTAAFTSVAPGADGTGGLAAFANRAGVANVDFFAAPGGLAASPDSLDNPYGRRQRRSAYFSSVVYAPFPWLELGADATYVRSEFNRGYDVLTANLKLGAALPVNPFGQDVMVSLNEITPRLGPDYSEARLDFFSLVGGLQLKLPSDWKVSLDTQFAHNTAHYRGISGADPSRWQQSVDEGRYNPLRDTEVHGPPADFYDRVLVYYGRPGQFSTLGSYDTLDAAFRVTDQSLPLPTGKGSLNVGADYRLNRLGSYTEELYYGDGTLADPPVAWSGRTLQRYSVFGELQGPLLPEHRLPAWLRKIETDLAVRYVAADTARETNIAPTLGLKAEFTGGLSFRGSFTTSNRVPTPQLSQPVGTTGSGTGVNYTAIADPLRNESYNTQATDAPNPALRPEAAVTETAGLIYQRGKVHQFRVSLDFVDTRKTDEVTVLAAQDVLDLESLFPSRVIRAPLAPGDTHTAGLVTSVLTGAINVASRHSQNWNTSFDYAWTQCVGGTLGFYARVVYFQRYDRQVFPTSPMVDELRRPDTSGTANALLKYRANLGASWSKRDYGFGLDGHYFHSRILPALEWPSQGGRQIDPYWQFDAFVQGDLGRWLPWKGNCYGLRGQLRVNNLFATGFPRYANDGAGAGVQPYGDWRGRTYSLSLTATF